jgi:hypothetical protein
MNLLDQRATEWNLGRSEAARRLLTTALQSPIKDGWAQKGEQMELLLKQLAMHRRQTGIASRSPGRIKAIGPKKCVYFNNVMTQIGSPSFESDHWIINGVDEHGKPDRLEAPVSKLSFEFEEGSS